jgi:hypothetical protein
MRSAFFVTCIGFLIAVFYPTSFPKPPYLAIKEEKAEESENKSSESPEEKSNEYYFNIWEWLDGFDFPVLDTDCAPSYSESSEPPSLWDDPSLQDWVDLRDSD